MQYNQLFQNKRLQAVLDQLPISVFVADHEGFVVWNNHISAEGIGLSQAEMAGKHVSDLEKQGILNPSVTRLALEQKKQITRVQVINEHLKQLMVAKPIYNEDGQIELIISISQQFEHIGQDDESIDEINDLIQTYILELHRFYMQAPSRESNKRAVTKSKAAKSLEQKVTRISSLPSTVLLTGETGVGKNYTARTIHDYSQRRSNSFLTLNCSTIPESLLESELFGYVKGAFSGANSTGKTGLVQMAEGGTLFLDEIAELPYAMQAKLLELVQDKTFLPIGSTEKRRADIRIIAATNQNLETLVHHKQFRSDLYYRLNVFQIEVPTLKERLEDLPLLAYQFVQKFNEEYHQQKKLSREAIETLTHYSWPGNIRELQHAIERVCVFAENDTISPEDFKKELQFTDPEQSLAFEKHESETLSQFLERIEKNVILQAADEHRNSREAAKSLGMSQPTFSRRVRKYET
ncbi:sigma-54 interaction domain-containing protein [Geomicrobium sediminis]|uniref:HTH-type transcriptional regulatory protein TyrR n=1 Tax=Geomicrobium sediminis TaxID=1347788 RepID=A0ABS2PFH0_9BACL|nr:sigma 54-interacting transcriptional regulator [Geomicrobium sediminis]MBM7634173.1 PAS domain S-box-containing protein [Geomicrobium sediminis]